MWDVENQEMIDADSLAFEEYAPLSVLLRDTEKQKFMQYTGIRDKNGIEIYEGDVVKVIPDHHPIVLFRVFWHDYSCGFMLEALDNGDKGNTIEKDDDIVVVGNIYQTPELVK